MRDARMQYRMEGTIMDKYQSWFRFSASSVRPNDSCFHVGLNVGYKALLQAPKSSHLTARYFSRSPRVCREPSLLFPSSSIFDEQASPPLVAQPEPGHGEGARYPSQSQVIAASSRAIVGVTTFDIRLFPLTQTVGRCSTLGAMSADSPITILLAKTKSNDNDVKTDAITKLQLELEGNTEVGTAPSIHASPSPSDYGQQPVPAPDPHRVHELRYALLAFLPNGGVIDRLGEPRETARAIAKDTLVLLGAAAFKFSGPAPASALRQKDHKVETLFVVLDKFLKDVGFGSKVWRVREQTILTLVELRRLHRQFPIRPFLSPLVEALEDSDGSVRDCARQSVITLFSGHAASDGARADLKNEMGRKGVRKADYSGSESSGAKVGASGAGDVRQTVTPSGVVSRPPLNSRTHTRTVSRELPRSNSRAAMVDEVLPPANVPSVIAAVFIASSRDLEPEFSRMMPPFELASLRTTVSANTCLLYSDLAVALGPLLDPFVDMLFLQLLRMAGFTKKIAAQQSQASVTSIISNTSCQPRVVIPHLSSFIQEKTVQARQFVLGHLIDKLLRKGLTDPNPGVKSKAREAYWIFQSVWPAEALIIMNSLDAVGRKQLEKANPDPRGVPAIAETEVRTPAKKSSVAAAIAASRAKAKAIATAPPTLRHAATSGANAANKASSPAQTAGRASFREIIRIFIYSIQTQHLSCISEFLLYFAFSIYFCHIPRFDSSTSDDVPPSDQGTCIKVKLSSRPPPPSHPRAISPPSFLPTGPSSPLSRSNGHGPALNHFTPMARSLNPLPQDSDSDDGDHGLDLASPTARHLIPIFIHITPSFTVFRKDLIPPRLNQPDCIPVEDALRAAAEQAESSAERLNELMEPDQLHVSPIPPSLILNSGTAHIPSTPMNRLTTRGVLKELELFQNSPAVKGSPSVMDRLYENKHQTGWWLKRKSLLDAGTPLKPEQESQSQELRSHIKALQDGSANVRTLQKLILLCNANPAVPSDGLFSPLGVLPSSPLPARGTVGVLQGDIWQGGKMFDELTKPLITFIRDTKDDELIEYGLCVVWEMVENQASYLDEAEVFSLLFHLRYANTHPILEATSTVRDALISRQEPVYGLKTLHACLSEFLSQPVPNCVEGRPDTSHVRTSSHAFGIIGLGKLIMRLPAEILEDELPLLKTTLTSVLDERDPSRTTIREAAYASIVAAQAILRDETRLFKLLDGLELSKKNLLTYYFDKHAARGVVEEVWNGWKWEAEEKVVKELLRLDTKISTPVK
ncbi:hypothetical protein BS47DRAFT_1388314 [Hydnum rufescens UP504]|uniref:CLASP N-terminal domain-containing protein n=1 Tax=Hydnum rufescens UP504 TaxID=1448309 RepID=A0A9P6B7R3_9AGAM|nr:hypothetical protein BS47DRAFT_1388314 [Hydnum rufescens UP504]